MAREIRDDLVDPVGGLGVGVFQLGLDRLQIVAGGCDAVVQLGDSSGCHHRRRRDSIPQRLAGRRLSVGSDQATTERLERTGTHDGQGTEAGFGLLKRQQGGSCVPIGYI